MSRASIVPPALLGVLALLPPETRGESLAGCAALIALLVLLVLPARAGAERVAPLLLLLLAAFPLALVAAAPGAVVEPMAVVFLAVAAGIGTALLPSEWRQRFPLPRLMAGLGAIVSLYAMYQVGWGLPALTEALETGPPLADQGLLLERARGGRAFALFSTPAALGGFLVLTLPVTLVAAASADRLARRLLLAWAALQVGGLVATASVTAIAALIGAVLTAALVRPRTRRLAGLAALGALIVLGTIAVLRGPEVLRPDDPAGPWRLRAGNFRAAASMIADRPWTGTGPGGFGEVYPAYRRPGDNETRHVHDLPLEAAAELGLPGGLLAAGLFFWLFLGPLWRRAPATPHWWRGVEIGLATFALHNLADFTAYMPSLLWTAAVLRGWVARDGAAEPGAGRLPAVVTATVCTVLVAGVAVFSGLARNDRASARQAAVEQRHEAAAALAARAVTRAPWSVDGRLLRARTVLATRPAALEEALDDAERAVTLSPVRPAARRLRSELRQAAGDLPGAYADALEAARLYPMDEGYGARRDALAERFRSAR